MYDLPERTELDEESFVRWWSDQDGPDGLIMQIEASMEAKRPILAARLVNLLDGLVEITPGSALHRARQAARVVSAVGASIFFFFCHRFNIVLLSNLLGD